jgi:hypothetical protein
MERLSSRTIGKGFAFVQLKSNRDDGELLTDYLSKMLLVFDEFNLAPR